LVAPARLSTGKLRLEFVIWRNNSEYWLVNCDMSDFSGSENFFQKIFFDFNLIFFEKWLFRSATKYVIKAAAISSEANKLGQYNFSEPVEKIAP
jgi:hypothetical protein